MRRTRRFTAAVGATAVVAGMTIAGASGVAGASSRPADTTLRGSVAPFTATSPVIGNLPASTKLSVQVWLRPRTTAAERYATAVSTPGSPAVPPLPEPGRVHRALRGHRGAGAQGRRVAALPGLHQRARRRWPFLRGRRGHGPAGRGRLPHPAPAVPVHRHGQRRPVRLHANASPVKVPSSLASSVLGVTGLDNAAPPPLIKPGPGRSPEGAAAPRGPRRRSSRARTTTGSARSAACPASSAPTKFPTLLCGYTGAQYRSVHGATMSAPARARPSRWSSWA